MPGVKYVICVPDGCADEPLDELAGRTPLEVASMPTLARLAARGEVGRAAVIPPRMAPGSDVGNMSILGYDPARYHTGRAPIEAAALGLRLPPDQVAYRCNLVDRRAPTARWSTSPAGTPSSEAAAEVIEALDAELGRGRRRRGRPSTPASSTATSSWPPSRGPTPTAPRPTTSPASRPCCPGARPRPAASS